MEYESKVIAWDAPEYHHIPRNSDWFWLLGILTISVAILCIVFSDVLFGIFILLAGLTLGLIAAREPSIVHFEIQPRGVIAHNLYYEYQTLESFWLDEYHPINRIILKSKKLLVPHITLYLSDDIHPHEAREYLLKHLPEVEHKESLAHQWLEHWGL